MERRRGILAVLVGLMMVVVLALGAGGLVLHGTETSTADAGRAAGVAVDAEAVSRLQTSTALLVRAVDRRDTGADGRVYRIAPDGTAAALAGLRCKRVAATPDGGGLCLAAARNGIDYDAVVFDRHGRTRLVRPIVGVPDRARVSRDGRYAAFTSFPHELASAYFQHTSDYSTMTRILDMGTGRIVQRLEDLAVWRGGRELDTREAEFWGVTFGDGDSYYATVAIEDAHYLIEGRVSERRARVVHRVVECPALSPDGSRIAYKRRVPGTQTWRLHVLDLATGEETPLAEPRSIDDQPEWIGDDWIAYSDDRAVFAVPARGGGSPVALARAATSVSIGAEASP